jgi:site-specific DNA-methyltransferase (adenine-specific)
MEPYWSDDLVTLYHGDCREIAEWLEVDVLVTDPPYGIGWKSRGGWTNAYGGGSAQQQDGILNDADTSARDDALAAWGKKPAAIFGDLLQSQPRGSVQVLVYAKSDDAGIRGAHGGFRRDVEAVYLAGKWPVGVGGRSSVLHSNGRVAGPRGMAARIGHPHAKPVDVLEDLIRACPPGVIADPFAGSGSTLVAARNLGRRAVGVELDERYCEMAARRLSQGILIAV